METAAVTAFNGMNDALPSSGTDVARNALVSPSPTSGASSGNEIQTGSTESRNNETMVVVPGEGGLPRSAADVRQSAGISSGQLSGAGKAEKTAPAADQETVAKEKPAGESDPPLPWKQCSVYRPSLAELQTQSFSTFIRNTVLKGSSPAFEPVDGGESFDDDENEACDYQHGMAKVVLPPGFLSKKGIAGDETARGPEWQAGRPLGDHVIGSPMRQYVRGLAGTYSYTLMDESQKTVAEFREIADAYQKQMLSPMLQKSCIEDQTKHDNSGSGSDPGTSSMSISAIERRFWKRLGPTMPPPMYGADQEGTMFHEDDEKTGWSLGHLDSCLHVLGHVPGVTSPYLYFGMFASVFCVHTEDMNLLSINYLHAGAPKIWYGISSAHAARFQTLASGCFCLEKCSEFLRHKQSLISPQVLQKAGIPFTFMVQYPGEAMVTFPGAYHFGFNAGFNIAEATNFGVPEWIPFGKQAKVCLCRPDSVRIDMQQFCKLLEVYHDSQKSRRRGARLSWKAWGENRRREQAKGDDSDDESQSDGGVDDQSNKVAEKAKAKKSDLSLQQRRKEFWVEVMKPVTKSNSSHQGRKEKKSKKRSAVQSPRRKEEEIWHLAQPVIRKRLVPETRVLVILPAKEMRHAAKKRCDGDGSDDDSVEDEQCFSGRIVEASDNHVRIHFDGLTKADDSWVEMDSPKLFLDGGRWKNEMARDMPKLHYWQEMDSKRRCTTKS